MIGCDEMKEPIHNMGDTLEINMEGQIQIGIVVDIYFISDDPTFKELNRKIDKIFGKNYFWESYIYKFNPENYSSDGYFPVENLLHEPHFIADLMDFQRITDRHLCRQRYGYQVLVGDDKAWLCYHKGQGTPGGREKGAYVHRVIS